MATQKQNKSGGTGGKMVVHERYGRKETKFVQNTNPGASLSTALTRVPMTSGIAGGSDIYATRVGRSIRLMRMRFRGQIVGGQNNSIADDPYNAVRLVVARGTPGFTLTGMTTCNGLDSRFSTNAGLLEVFYDRTVVVNTFGKDSTGYIACASEWDFELQLNFRVEFGSASAGVPLNQELVMFMTSDSTAVTNPGFSTNSVWLVEYVDEA